MASCLLKPISFLYGAPWNRPRCTINGEPAVPPQAEPEMKEEEEAWPEWGEPPEAASSSASTDPYMVADPVAQQADHVEGQLDDLQQAVVDQFAVPRG